MATWNAVSTAATYELWVNRVSSDAQGKVFYNASASSGVNVSLPAGEYRGWVRAIGERGQTSWWSFAVTFQIADAAKTVRPDLLAGTESQLAALHVPLKEQTAQATTLASSDGNVQTDKRESDVPQETSDADEHLVETTMLMAQTGEFDWLDKLQSL